MKNLNKPIFFLVVLFIGVTFLSSCKDKQDASDIPVDEGVNSFSFWMNRSRDNNHSIDQRQIALRQAYRLTEELDNDTLQTINLRAIAFQAYKLNDSLFFRKTNNEAFELTSKIKDTLGIADTYWNYGAFYAQRDVYDSAYSNYQTAHNYYSLIRNEYYAGKMLYNMAFIKGRLKDYTGSEVLTFQAITKFKRLKRNKSLYTAYNHLATLYKGLGEYSKAHFYNEQALYYLSDLDDKKTFYEGTLNNIGLIYHEEEKYEEAIEYFNRALARKNLKQANIDLYVRLIDNRAHSKLLNKDTTNIYNEFSEALHIRDSVSNYAGIVINKLHLAQYFGHIGDTSRAIALGMEASELAKEINNNSDYLASLRLLSELDRNNSNEYLEEFIQMNDSLQTLERRIRDKFTRIDFETDTYIEQTERLSQQKILILVVGISLVLILSLLYFATRQYAKGKEILFESEQRKANEKIYLLSLKQQAKLQEGKVQERNRISEELHDGVLGKLFGTRVGLGFLNPGLDVKGSEKYKNLLDELQIIEKEIRDISHELKNHDNYASSTGFFNLVTKLLIDSSETGKFEYKLEKEAAASWGELDETIKAHLYRIIQESLQNTIKYANATRVVVEFLEGKECLVLKISDNGTGFRVDKRKTGIGLKNMKSRTIKLKGELSITSELDKGTTIKVVIPQKEKK
ncbi:ATP-binding protein [Aureisphaera galaxeae]|uniref:tetratricopeptide repeat-containing sensor histidine kinase n=1 Tax=Aureisphaera galaxeae TaxID=1538023 RepID=UPI00235016FE|nr:ATP-binding protein [Aureisphaera galaxeae]MDC8004741.1 ATP-binding protein [Aureisphaera galaxeae]